MMASPLPIGYRIVDTKALSHDALWRAIDELAYEGDIAVSCPDTAVLHACIETNSGIIVGAVWSDSVTEIFDFHLAVASAHRGAGLGRWLIDAALHAYEQEKEKEPGLQIRVYVVERRVWHALNRRGLRVISDHRALHRGHFAVEMGTPTNMVSS